MIVALAYPAENLTGIASRPRMDGDGTCKSLDIL